MRTTAFVIVAAALVALVDIGQESAARVRDTSRRRMDDQVKAAVEDWEIGTYFAAGLAAAGLLWIGLRDLPDDTRGRRLFRMIAGGGTVGAVAGGGGLSVVASVVVALATGKAAALNRHEMEARWLAGSVGGGLCGMLLGTGIGAVRSVRTSPRHDGPLDLTPLS